MNINNLKNKNIHFIECENWNDAYGYEKSQMKENTINYIEQLQQENKQLKLINKEHQQINGELRQANKLLNEQYIRLYKDYQQVKYNGNMLKEYINNKKYWDGINNYRLSNADELLDILKGVNND